MPLLLPQTYDEAFVALIERLRMKYPAELFLLEGIHETQLDINHMSREYFSSANRKGAATADHSIDPNANVSGRDVITFNYEVPKPIMKLNSLFNLWNSVRKADSIEAADAVIEAELTGRIYINDSWDNQAAAERITQMQEQEATSEKIQETQREALEKKGTMLASTNAAGGALTMCWPQQRRH